MLNTLKKIAKVVVLAGICTGSANGYEAPRVSADTQERPNILFCMADDWGWPHAEPYGDKVVRTPTFSRLAREGALFDHAFVSSPSCTPCRSSILTGQQFYRLGRAANLKGPLDINQPNFMFMLRSAGYDIGHHRKAWDPGKYEQGGYTEHPCGPETSFADFVKNRDSSKPFCFWLGTTDPHRGYKAGTGAESGLDLDAIEVPGYFPDTPAVRSDIADYYYEVERWDSNVGSALKILEAMGELDNTIIVMTGDHGMPFPRCKGSLYDWGVRVPFVVRWGDAVEAGVRLPEFISLTDLAPTFLEIAGVPVPEIMTGQSLVPLLKDGSAAGQQRDYAVMGRERHTKAQEGKKNLDGYPSRGIRNDRWLLIQNLEPDRWPGGVAPRYRDCDGSPTKEAVTEDTDSFAFAMCFAQRPALELYDIDKDPHQLNNLAENPECQEVLEQLKAQLQSYLVKTEDPRASGAEVLFDTYPY